MRWAGWNRRGRIATRLAQWPAGVYKERRLLAYMGHRGYISPKAEIACRDLVAARNVFIDDGVTIYQHRDGGAVRLGEGASLYRSTIIETGEGGCVEIGPDSHVQPRCQFTAFMGSVRIGKGVQIAPNCAFYPYEHTIGDESRPIQEQGIHSRGDIVVEDGAWLGVGVIVLDGVTIGRGAVIGAGAVVTKDVPPNSVVVGIPARVVRQRGEAPP